MRYVQLRTRRRRIPLPLLDASALLPSRTGRNHLLWLAHSQVLGARRVAEVTAHQATLEQAYMEPTRVKVRDFIFLPKLKRVAVP